MANKAKFIIFDPDPIDKDDLDAVQKYFNERKDNEGKKDIDGADKYFIKIKGDFGSGKNANKGCTIKSTKIEKTNAEDVDQYEIKCVTPEDEDCKQCEIKIATRRNDEKDWRTGFLEPRSDTTKFAPKDPKTTQLPCIYYCVCKPT